MPAIYLIYPFLVASSLLFSLLLLILTYKYRRHQLSQAIMGLALTALGIASSILLSIYGSDAIQAAWWHGNVRVALYGFIPLTGYIFTSNFTRSQNINKRGQFPRFILFMIPMLTVLISLTNLWHHWFIRFYHMELVNGYFIRTAWEPGFWFWVHSLYSYVVGAYILWTLAVWVWQTKRLPRWRGLLFLSVVILSGSAVSVDTLGLYLAPGLLSAPIIFGVTSFLLILGVWYIDLLDILPVARETLISYLPDAVLITDNNNLTLDINTAGETLLGRTLAELRGKDILQFLSSENQNIVKDVFGASDFEGIRSLKIRGETRWFDIHLKRILLEGEFPGGKIITLRDITDQRELQERDRQRVAFEERQRLARDLHDAVSQTLFSARLTSDMLLKQKETVQPDFLWKSISHISNLVKGALGEMRILLVELRPESFENAELGTLLSYLADAASSQTEAEIQFQKQIQCTLPANVKIAFYRIAQEALNNVIKHANSSHVAIRIVCQDQLVQLAVEDDGQGFDFGKMSGTHMGLKIMRERADEIGATLEIQSRLQEGTCVTCTWQP
jgi:PAS domain S-box-containing protein